MNSHKEIDKRVNTEMGSLRAYNLKKALEEDMASWICQELLGKVEKALKEGKKKVPFTLNNGCVGVTLKGHPVPSNAFIIWEDEIDDMEYVIYCL